MVRLNGINVAYGDRYILRDANVLVRTGDRIGLVGPNGAGKSTLLRVICGEEKPDSGEVLTEGGTIIGYFSQNVGEMQGRTALEEVIAGSGAVYEIGLELEKLEHRMADPEGNFSDADMDRYGELQSEYLVTGMTWSAAVRRYSPAWASPRSVITRWWKPSVVDGRCASPWPKYLPSCPMCS